MICPDCGSDHEHHPKMSFDELIAAVPPGVTLMDIAGALALRKRTMTKKPEELDEDEVNALFRHKNSVILDLDRAQKEKTLPAESIVALALEGAVLEEKVAAYYLCLGKKEEAAINFTSAASCFVAAKNFDEARRTLDRAAELTVKDSMQSWIKSYRKRLA